MQKTILCASFTLALIGGIAPAHAADAPAINWNGPYIGVTLGYGGASGTQRITTADPNGSLVDPSGLSQSVLYPAAITLPRRGVIGGGEIGYNVQRRNWLVGVEYDFSGLDADANGSYAGTLSDASKAPFPDYTSTNSANSHLNFLSTGRARVGYVHNKTLVFASGGFALGDVSTSGAFAINNTGNPPADLLTGTREVTKFGYAVGGGIEHKLSQHVSIKTEYLYYDLGNVRYSTAPNAFTAGDIPGVQQNINYRVTGNVVRAGLNFHF